jgi:hypothetical protein
LARIVRLDCKFCGAREEKTVENDDAIKVEAVLWIRKHQHCADGREMRFDIGGQKDEASPVERLGSFTLKR